MDIKIENNDIKLKPNSEAYTVCGIEQALQQATLALKIPRGSFIYDRNAGALENGFDLTQDGVEGKIEARLNESLIHSDFIARVLYIADGNSGTVVGIEVDNGKTTMITEVELDG